MMSDGVCKLAVVTVAYSNERINDICLFAFFCLPPLLSPPSLSVQYRAALLSLMVDTAIMLGAPEKTALTQMEKALAFETKLAHVKMSIR